MSDWAVGDLVVCVDDGPVRALAGRPSIRLIKGQTYTITAIRPVYGGASLHILVDNEPSHGSSPWGFIGWDSSRFRKVTPDKHEACEEEFQVLLRRSRRKVGA